MTYQRRSNRLGMTALFWPAKPTDDSRGSVVLTPHLDEEPLEAIVAEMQQRSSKAEVPGQQEVNVVRLMVPYEIGIQCNLRTRVHHRGLEWDVAAPPILHFGPRRHTRHVSMDLRQRTIKETTKHVESP